MDFFQAQDSARRKSKRLVFFYLAAVVLIVLAVYAVVIAVWTGAEVQTAGRTVAWWQPDVFAGTALGTIGIIALGSLFKILSLRGGGGVVARSVGGKQVDPGTTDPKLRRLLNVVEEMAIASGVRVPEVYLLPEDGINAFAAGYSPDDAAVAVTRGALDTLNRDELQGVIAHEFSHILNGDMRLNIRLIGLLFGILLLAIVGRTIVYSMRFSRVSSGRGKGSGGAAVAIILTGIALLIVGYVGVFFGRLIQAAVSRQREYLADAAAVQFTRNPAGIAGALKKIGALEAGSQVRNVHAAETSHLFFANAMAGTAFNLFATHPPLIARIRAIDPSFDGNFASIRVTKQPHPSPKTPPRAKPPPLSPDHFMTAITTAVIATEDTRDALAEIPPTLIEVARDPSRARIIPVGVLLADSDDAVDTNIRTAIDNVFDEVERESIRDCEEAFGKLPRSARLAAVDLALPSIRRSDRTKIENLLRCIDLIIEADGQTSLFEFALRRVVARNLLSASGDSARRNPVYFSQHPLVDEISRILSALAHAGGEEPSVVQRAFDAGAAQLGQVRQQLSLQPAASLTGPALTAAIDRLDLASLPIKKNLIRAMAHTAAADGVIRPAEAELLRVVAAALDCPAPPLQTSTAAA